MNSPTLSLQHLQNVATDADGWFSMPDVQLLFPDTPARTLRFHLERLHEHLEVRGEKRGRRYRLKTDSRQPATARSSASDYDIAFSDKARLALLAIERDRLLRPPIEYQEAWLDAYIPNQTFYLPKPARQLMEALGKQSGLPDQAGTYVLRIYDQLLLDVSYNSSRMEGNTYSRDEVQQLINSHIPAPGKTAAETTMVLNHKDAMEYLVRRIPDDQLTLERITTLHALLSDNLVDFAYSGKIRDKDVLIGNSAYIPLSGEGSGQQTLTRLLQKVVDKANVITNVFERSLFILLHISWLQAFIDVNKRTGRLACVLPLIRHDYIPIAFVGVDQKTYAACLVCFYETGNTRPMAEYFVACYEKSCNQFKEAARLVGWDELAARYRSERKAMLGRLIRENLLLSDATDYLHSNMPGTVASDDQAAFVDMVRHAAEAIALPHIAGLGISRQELNAWLTRNGKKNL